MNNNLTKIYAGTFITLLGSDLFISLSNYTVINDLNEEYMWGIYLAIGSLPALIFQFVSFKYIHKINVKKGIVFIDFFLGIFNLIIGIFLIFDILNINIYLIVFVNFITTIMSSIYSPLTRKLLPLACKDRDKLPQTNAHIQSITRLSRVVTSFLLLLFIRIDEYLTYIIVINSISYLISSFIEYTIVMKEDGINHKQNDINFKQLLVVLKKYIIVSNILSITTIGFLLYIPFTLVKEYSTFAYSINLITPMLSALTVPILIDKLNIKGSLLMIFLGILLVLFNNVFLILLSSYFLYLGAFLYNTKFDGYIQQNNKFDISHVYLVLGITSSLFIPIYNVILGFVLNYNSVIFFSIIILPLLITYYYISKNNFVIGDLDEQ